VSLFFLAAVFTLVGALSIWASSKQETVPLGTLLLTSGLLHLMMAVIFYYGATSM
jgi:drug/metabolite transporter superfamily protein YnfA